MSKKVIDLISESPENHSMKKTNKYTYKDTCAFSEMQFLMTLG